MALDWNVIANIDEMLRSVHPVMIQQSDLDPVAGAIILVTFCIAGYVANALLQD